MACNISLARSDAVLFFTAVAHPKILWTRTELNGVPEEQVGALLEDMVGEVHDDYFDAVKQCMVEYVLKSNVEGTRLEITKPLPKFERKVFHPSQDPSVAETAMPKGSPVCFLLFSVVHPFRAIMTHALALFRSPSDPSADARLACPWRVA